MRALWAAFALSLTLTLLLAGAIVFASAERPPIPPLLAGEAAQAQALPIQMGVFLPAQTPLPALSSPGASPLPSLPPPGSPVSTQTLPGQPGAEPATQAPPSALPGLIASTPTLSSPVAGDLPPLFSLTSPLTTTVTITPTQESWSNFMPLVLRQEAPTPTPPPPESRKVLACASPNAAIPDNNATGRTVSMTLDDPGQVVDVRIYVRIHHTWVGDLTARVEHLGLQAKLFDRPGIPATSYGCELDDIRAIFDETMEHTAENACFNTYIVPGIIPPAISGSFAPLQPLDVFFALPVAGTWSLRVLDESIYDTGTLVDWCLDLTVLDAAPTPTPTPTPVELPASAAVSGMSGQTQLYMLDCESRSAVDWARHWGVWISEYEFFWGLPTSVNPEKGFVGNVTGTWGLVPPEDYGVHAPPIAVRLREYGLKAQARKYLRWDELRAEIAAGRPVMVWIVDTLSPGAPRYYNPGVGPYTVTVPYEHTMIVTGYTATTVTLLDGAYFRTVSTGAFLDSWSALGNMAVVYVP